VRFNKFADIFNRYDIAQSDLEISIDTDHTSDRELFENQYYEVEASFNELLHPVLILRDVTLLPVVSPNKAIVFTAAVLT